MNSIETGEWLQYTVDITASGVYNLKLATAAAEEGGMVSLTVNGTKIGKAVAVPVSGGPAQFKETAFKNVILAKGIQVIRIYADRGEFTLSSLQFTIAD